MYKRNLRQEKYVENISNPARTELQRMGLEGRSAIPWACGEELFSYGRFPIASPSSSRTASCSYLQVLAVRVLVSTLVIHTEKAGVGGSPWRKPGYRQRFNCGHSWVRVPNFGPLQMKTSICFSSA
jgi:hypothetical protein